MGRTQQNIATTATTANQIEAATEAILPLTESSIRTEATAHAELAELNQNGTAPPAESTQQLH